jgi:hypothetical protein
MEYKEAPTQEDLNISFKHGFKAMVERRKILGETQPSNTQTDTQVNKINEDYL